MKKKNNNIKDRHLDAPSEADRDKHINFVALEAGDIDPADFDEGELLNSPENNDTRRHRREEEPSPRKTNHSSK
jgi:hypothetical protein